ncbi:MAG: RtcB family protein [Candidatus Parabeggiatoa sp. nov. 3]|nr:MAG: RtcB family protein [Gammaproteobacteria bacterium]RKZ68880.1 MAG: RtcB family protein [Gammaproteobacteria bacterium]RKZ79617.1 MAG: RtcB family protein [Gammaproteobacteria bacterium]HEW97717.1 RtcB family protein [Beggiatoa sp.]
MPIKRVLSTGRFPVKIYTDDIESEATQQLHELSTLPFIHKHVAAMPDVHLGIGATIGSVIPTKGAIIPAAVGVDLGCGMAAVQLSLKASDLPDNLYGIRSQIEEAVPVGFNQHENPVLESSLLKQMKEQLDELLQKHPTLLKMKKHFDDWQLQVGTLGSGNHFIEVCLDENQAIWVMLHSGSRGLGNLIGRYFIAVAKKDMEKWFISLPNKDLAYFPQGTEHFNDYWQAVMWAQEYARVNREEMMRLILEALSHVDLPPFEITGEAISCHHNYVALENHYKSNIYLTRKGAISARTGEWGIIPGSMGTKSYIVKGKGNPESFCSCSHGAGRRMGRKEAKRRFSTEDMITQTQGVECRKDEGVIDEIPAAYKPIDEVMENQNDLVEIVHTLKQVVCIKG